MLKRLNDFGEAAWDFAVDCLWLAARLLVVAAIAGVIYLAVQAFGFAENLAAGLAMLSVLVTAAAWPHLGTLMALLLIVAVILAFGFLALSLIITPPSLYSLVVVGLVLLAGILWQLTKLANKQ